LKEEVFDRMQSEKRQRGQRLPAKILLGFVRQLSDDFWSVQIYIYILLGIGRLEVPTCHYSDLRSFYELLHALFES
jgi:hypothetical protein